MEKTNFKRWCERNDLELTDLIFGALVLICFIMLFIYHGIVRRIERNVIETQQIYVEPEGSYAEFNDNVYKHESE